MLDLLSSKLRMPSPPSMHVQRPRIIQAMSAGLAAGRALTLVSAPAGFGKTTCVSEWLHGLGLPAAWLSLDPSDDEPGRFFTYFLTTLQKLDAGIGREILAMLRAGQLPPAEVISTTLINDILSLEGSGLHSRFILALDDFHVIQDRFILQVMEKLLGNLFQAGMRQPLHLALVTREDPPLPLARLRANNRLTEIRAADLRFTPGEAERFLNEALGLCLSQSDLASLEERTEGWIAGLHLAGLSIRDREDPAGFIATLSGSHRYILNYLTEEVLARQPEEIQQFLLDTSILERLCGDLCDAVTGREDGRQTLERLYSANLFLAPLDGDDASAAGGGWYRYHPLFADLLRDRQKALQKGRTAGLHRRAGQWYARQQAPSFAGEAIRHALAAADFATAVQLIERHSLEMLMQWYSKKVAEWMEALPPEWAAQSPRANLAFAWMHIMRRSFQQAAPYLQRLQSMFSAQDAAGYDPSVTAEWLALQATLCSGQGKPAECVALAERALQIVPPQDGYVRSLISLGLAGAYQQLDDQERAMEAYRLIIQYGRESGNLISELLGISALGLMALQQGRLHYGFEVATQGIERVEHSGMLPPIAQALYGEVAQVYYQWHQLDQARQNFMRSIQVSALNGYAEAEVYQGVIFSRLYQMQGDLENAAVEIRKAAERMQAGEVIAINEEVISQQVRVALAQGRLSAAEAALAGSQGLAPHAALGGPLSDFEPGQNFTYPQGLIYNTALRIRLYRGLAGRSQVEGVETRDELPAAIKMAGRLLEAALRRNLMPNALESLLLRAQMHAGLRDEPAALADLVAALEMAEPEGFISNFVEEGAPIAALLEALLASGRTGKVTPAYIRRVLGAFPGWRSQQTVETMEPAALLGPQAVVRAAPAIAPELLPEALTARELDVLRLMAGGLKYSEIAEKLYISLNTVRTHVKVIYGKLGVNNRTTAIALAKSAGLI
jgi:LuxR family maltose regulon positive regulatory protein